MKLTRKICPYCNANCSAGDTVCWLCFSPFPERIGEASAGTIPASEQTVAEAIERPQTSIVANEVHGLPNRSAPGSFGLMSLMMIVTLIAVCMGAFTVAPGLGILLSVLATPALVRTVVLSIRRREAGVAVSAGDKAMMFVASLGALITAGLVAIAVFFGTCVAFCFGAIAMEGSGVVSGQGMQTLIWVFVLIGAAAGIASGILILRRFWRAR